MEVFQFIIWAVGVVLTFVVADKNGRNKWLALFWGILFSWLALIVYAIMGRSFEKKLEQANALSKAAETTYVPPVEEAPVKAPRKPRAKKTVA